jgi:hypothetical protein
LAAAIEAFNETAQQDGEKPPPVSDDTLEWLGLSPNGND